MKKRLPRIDGRNQCGPLRARTPPVVLRRDQAYIGVLIDDLITKEHREPYRIMTSRAEYRLLLRQDNADLRLAPLGREIGLLPEERYRVEQKRRAIQDILNRLAETWLPPTDEVNAVLTAFGQSAISDGINALQLLRRPDVSYEMLERLIDLPEATDSVKEQVCIEAKYSGYIKKQQEQVEKVRRTGNTRHSSRFRLRQPGGPAAGKRERNWRFIGPTTLGQATRLAGVNPADIAALLVHLERGPRSKCANLRATARPAFGYLKSCLPERSAHTQWPA